ncbi:MAG: aspartate/glutamate racemase family protein [Alphaproteobacteria bacterium]|nr:aspartate/glutamate racemase family protein [Alphaproteobacteria bacterium]
MEQKVGPRTLLGVLTPSSNTVLEPFTSAMLSDLPDVTAHFGRFRVREISLRDEALGQFDSAPILDAAELLADAKVGSIIWNGTSSGWMGFEADEALCREITAATGIPAGTSVLALNEIFTTTGVERFGLVTPYLDEIQERIVANYQAAGFACVAERHLGDRGNFSFSDYSEELIASMVRDVAAAKPEAITVFCTNFRGTALADRMEAELGIPIYDTVATGVWKGMKLANADPSRIKGWGRLFSEVK